ncbi:glycerol kinase GlpK [Microlunatus sp. GCM10028923]|uniref:glycerol kinase GlpK n=1 Tax=Microlunatus sp. GCM10028923 TaxID=3273400 RepID=UPI0036146496
MSETAPRRLLAAVDFGTQSTRCVLFDPGGRLVSIAQTPQPSSFPRPGWVELDAYEAWLRTERAIQEALRKAGAEPGQVVALGLANQRESVVVWDRRTGRPVANAISWQDTRTQPWIEEFRAGPDAAAVTAASGLEVANYYAAPRLRWLLDHTPGLRARAERGDVLAGTLDTWLVWNLTGGPAGGRHLTDVTNASRTLLMDLGTLRWHPDLLAAFDIPAAMLPEIRPSLSDFGLCRAGLPGIEVSAVLGDQQAALFGQQCFAVGDAKCTLGSGTFVLMNTGTERHRSDHGLITTVAYQIGDQPAVYAVEGSIAVTGSLVSWLRDGLELIKHPAEIETLALSVPDNGGCYLVPAFAGLLAPHWQETAGGVVVGLTSFITKGHLARAALEAAAWQTRDVIDAMSLDATTRLTLLRVDGGMTANHLLMQLLADYLGVPVERSMMETVSLGAAYAAGVSAGFWPTPAAIPSRSGPAGRWEPDLDPDRRAVEHENWRRAVRLASEWAPRGSG